MEMHRLVDEVVLQSVGPVTDRDSCAAGRRGLSVDWHCFGSAHSGLPKCPLQSTKTQRKTTKTFQKQSRIHKNTLLSSYLF